MIKFDKNNLHVVYINKDKGVSSVDFDVKLKNCLELLKKDAQNYMSDSRFYREINEDFRNESDKIFAKAVSLGIEQHPEDCRKHILKVTVLHPSMQIQSTRAIASGSKEDILKYLKDTNLENTIKSTITSISKKLEDK